MKGSVVRKFRLACSKQDGTDPGLRWIGYIVGMERHKPRTQLGRWWSLPTHRQSVPLTCCAAERPRGIDRSWDERRV